MRRSTPPRDRERRVGRSLGEDREAIDLLADEWQPDSDELTPTMKLKRRPITHKYASQIDTLYPTKETR